MYSPGLSKDFFITVTEDWVDVRWKAKLVDAYRNGTVGVVHVTSFRDTAQEALDEMDGWIPEIPRGPCL